ncbi:MAG: sulfatase [Pirellulaceae bacterium]|nr:sulfatase [Pirellulaceae bacterium]
MRRTLLVAGIKCVHLIHGAFIFLVVAAPRSAQASDGETRRPHVLFIAVDDLNDWCGPLGGHALVKTPNLDRLARRGTTFTNAHCNSPLCNSSRASLLFGLRPTTTGIYGLSPSPRALPEFAELPTLPQYFGTHGYTTYGVGKIFHSGVSAGPLPGNARSAGTPQPDFMITGSAGGIGARPPSKLVGPTPMGNNPLMDWGVFAHEDKDKGDYQVASWAVERILKAPKDRPLLFSAGFFLPHVPCYATQPWFDLYPNDQSVLPEVFSSDRDDTPRFSWYTHWHLPEPRLKWLQERDQWINLVRSYLACVSFVDAQIGRVLDALEQAGLADRTIVVLWSDHGWHLGEKGITGKNSLWDRSTRVPLIFAGPGITAGARCDQPVELLDVYPSLVELCGLTARQDLEGLSLVDQLRDPHAVRTRPAITSHNQGNHGIRSQHYRLIRYADGSEEFYDYRTDPREWHNVVGQSQYAELIAQHRRWLPTIDRPPASGSAHRILTYDADSDTAVWEGAAISRADPIPE